MKHWIVFLTWSFAFVSPVASQTYYAPNMLNIPCLQKKGQMSLGLAVGRSPSLDVQLCLSPVKKLAIMANYFGIRKKEVRDFEKMGSDLIFGELGLGFYEALPKGAASFFAGFGQGTSLNVLSGRYARLIYHKYFLQPAIQYKKEHFYAGIAMRIAYLNFYKGDVDYNLDEFFTNKILALDKDSPIFLPEIGVQFGLSVRPVNIFCSFNLVFPDTERWGFAPFLLSAGISTDFMLPGTKEKKSGMD